MAVKAKTTFSPQRLPGRKGPVCRNEWAAANGLRGVRQLKRRKELLHLAGVALVAWAVLRVARQFLSWPDMISQILLVAMVLNVVAYVPSTLANATDLNAREFAVVLPFGAVLAGRTLAGGHTNLECFSLLGAESLILEQSETGNILDSIKDCLRCGKCKPVCATHVPRANLLYSPRNKILATSLLIEAFLYEEQTRRGVSIRHWEEFEDVADHCTVCHKCLSPCPVDIDFGDVSMNMRNLLRKMDKKSFNPGKSAAMFFLNAALMSAIFFMAQFQQAALGAGPLTAGLLTFPEAIGIMAGNPRVAPLV